MLGRQGYLKSQLIGDNSRVYVKILCDKQILEYNILSFQVIALERYQIENVLTSAAETSRDCEATTRVQHRCYIEEAE